MPFEDLLRGWDGEFLATRFDQAAEAWMLVGVHSTVLGPAMGGTRLKAYPSAEEAARDVLRLSQAMTMKQAAADLPFGGGKAVLAVPEVPAPGSTERRDLLHRYADLVDGLGGSYVTAADMNTGEADMDTIGERTTHVLGRSSLRGGAGDPAVGTARGVFHAIRAACLEAFGSDAVAGKTVLIQGCGAVGDRLADHLAEAGASLLLADIDAGRAETTARRTGGATVATDAVIGTPCDVYAPCATGAVLSEDAIGRLACTAVAGAANNQLATSEDGDRIRAASIVYAPDYVANAGGVIWLAGYETLGWTDAAMQTRLEGIADTLAGIFETARTEGIATATAADRLALRRLDAAR
jgi:leucine dehydrogenase